MTARPTTTTTARPRPTTTTAAPVTPLRIKSFVVNQFGQAVSRPRTTPAPVRRPATTTTARTVQEARQPKAVSAAAAKGNYQYEGRSYLLTWDSTGTTSTGGAASSSASP